MEKENLSRLIGLWLSEGSTKSKNEITFTNSQPELIRFFHRNLFQYFRLKNKPRIYVYRRNKKVKVELPIPNLKYKFYVHPLSRRPFFIYRVSGIELVKRWQNTVKKIKNQPRFYQFILQGFFSGKGNIKFINSTKIRVLRISQGKPNEFLEKIFQNLYLDFKFEPRERSYVISRRENLEKLWELKISKLHPIKHQKFSQMLKSYKQRHLRKGELKREILNFLKTPKTSKELSQIFGKSHSRVTRILVNLNKENSVKKFRIGSVSYWIKSNEKIILISKTKSEILRLLNKPKKVFELSKIRKRSWKSTFRRLKELEKLGLVKEENTLWHKILINSEVMVL